MNIKKRILTFVNIIILTMVAILAITVTAENTAGKITLTKTAEANDDRTATITLGIHPSQLTQVKTDIVIVMDRSGSMAQTTAGRYRLTVAKEQAVELVKEVLPKNNKGNVKVGVVTFGTNYEAYYSTTSYSKMATTQEEAITTINNIQRTTSNGTNVQAGLKAAKDLLASSPAQNKIIILISDGQPTYFSIGNELCGDGNNDKLDSDDSYICRQSGKIPSTAAEDEANALKAANVEIYAVGYAGTSGLNNFLKNKIVSGENETERSKHAFAASDTAGLNAVMQQIATNIKHILATNAEVVDTIPAGFEITSETKEALIREYGNKIVFGTDEDGDTTITVEIPEISSINGPYTISYDVKAKDNYNGAMYTNKSATFTANKTADNKYYDEPIINLTFDKPVAPIATVTQDDDFTDKNILEGQTVTLTKEEVTDNDIINELKETLVLYPNQNTEESKVNHEIVIDNVSCGDATVEKGTGNILYTAKEGCDGNPTITYHIVSTIEYDTYNYETKRIEREKENVISVAKKGNKYEKSSTITLAVERVPVVYTVKYVDQSNNKDLIAPKTVTGKKNRDSVTETALNGYEQTPTGVEILRQYDLVGNKTQTITLKKENNVITFYYTKKEIKTDEPTLVKESSTTSITSLKDPINYTISYNTEINDFKGELVVTLIDSLPHKIVENESTYKCSDTSTYKCSSVYNAEKETITYTLKYNIDTFQTGRKFVIDFDLNIRLKYDENDFDGSESSITNRISTQLTAAEVKIDSYDDKEIPADIKGIVEAKYVYINSINEETPIAEGKYDTKRTYKVGSKYETSKLDIPGYTYKEVRGVEKGTVKEGTTVITYVYTKKPFEVSEDPEVIKKAANNSLITSTNQEITYTIDYTTSVKYHDGDVTLQIIDKLEYQIESVKVNSTGWTAQYDNDKTIVFTKPYHIHTSLTETNEVEIEEILSYTIKLKSFAVEADQDQKFTNRAQGSIIILGNTKTGEEEIEEVPMDVKGNVLVHYKEKGTNRELKTSTYLYRTPQKVGTEYTTTAATISGYTYANESVGPTTGIVRETITEVTYYYTRNSATPDNPVLTKTGTTSITSVDEIVHYNISYDAIIKNYEGHVKITMIDTLPYKIDLENSIIGGNYIYNEETNELSWIIYEDQDVDATDEIPISFEVELKLAYIGIDPSITSFTNTAKIHIEDGTIHPEDQTEDHETLVDVDGTVIVKHVNSLTNEEIPSVTRDILTGKVGTAYTTNSKTILGYDLVETEIPANKTGNYIDGTIIVIYKYAKKPIKITDETITKTTNTNKVISTKQNVDYEINYNAKIEYRGNITITIVDQLDRPIDLENSNIAGGIYDPQNNTITWTESINRLNTYLTGHAYHASIQKVVSLRYKDVPSNGKIKNIAKVYIKTEEGQTPTKTSEDVIVPTEIKGNLVVEYIYAAENGTLTELNSYTKNDYVGNDYQTQAKNFNGYKLRVTPRNANGVIIEGTTRVTYFYEREKAEVKENEVIKTSKEEVVTNINDSFDYNIKYNTELDKYIGPATITIVDQLKHPIDLEKSNIANGVYNEDDLTITWIFNYNVNTYENINKNINVNIDIKLYYKGLNPTERVVKNDVVTKIMLETIDEPVESKDEEETKLEVKGTVRVKYLDVYGQTLLDSVLLTGLVGDEYQTTLEDIEGYILNRIEGNETGTYKDGEIEVVYIYEKEGTGEIIPPNTNATSPLSLLILISGLIITIFISSKNKYLKNN